MAIRSVIISTDSVFRELARKTLGAADGPGVPVLELSAPFREFTDQQLASLRQAGPELVILDLENEPELGIKLAQFLSDQNPTYRLIAVGPTLEPTQFMAAMRAGVADYLPKPVQPELLMEAVGRTALRLGKAPTEGQRKPGVIYPVLGAKGGAGSTVFACNLAVVLHRLTGKRTLLVDLDLELGETAVMLGVQPRFSLVDFVENFRRMDAGLLASYIEQHESGVHLLSAPLQPDKAETITADQIRRIFHFLRQHYDYILVDTARTFAPQTLAVLEQADLTFLITTVDLPSLRNIQRGLPLLTRVLSKGEEQVRLIVNRHGPHDPITLKDIEGTVGLKVSATLGNDYEAVMSSVNAGRPIVLNGSSPYSRDLKQLAAQLTGLDVTGKRARGGVVGALAAPFSGLINRMKRSPGKYAYE